MLKVRDVHKNYGTVHALSGVDLDVSRGEILALLGQNGAGKTTLVSIVAGLRRADRGAVWVNDINVAAQPEAARRALGFAPQEIGVYPTVSVKDNLCFFGELGGLGGTALHRRVAETAEAFSLVELLDRRAHSLSGGEARRLHTAMIVLHSPPLLLLDEPTAGMDVGARNQFLALIKTLADEGSTVVYSTHYLQEVEQLEASCVAILVHGKVAAQGSIPHLIGALGGAFVELRFDGAPPPADLPPAAVVVGEAVVRIPTDESPAIAAAGLLQSFDGAATRLREIRLIQPNLESVFLHIASGAPTES